MTTSLLEDKLIKKIPKLIEEMKSKQIERDNEISMLVLTLFSKKNLFFLGSPGVGKTGILEVFSSVLENGKTFDWTIKNDTKYEELFGDRYHDDNGKLHYDTTNSMIDSHISILDEIWKGDSKILNSLLSITSNSRTVEVRGIGRVKTSNIATFSASNELPMDESLGALKDRFHVRMLVEPIEDDKNWMKFISRDYDRDPILKTKFTLEDIETIFKNAMNVEIPEDIYMIMLGIKNRIKAIELVCSDRRFDSASDILRVCAYLNGRGKVVPEDLFILKYIVWEVETDIAKIFNIICETIFGNIDEVENYFNKLNKKYTHLQTKKEAGLADFIKFRQQYNGETMREEFNSNLNFLSQYCIELEQVYKNYNSIIRHYEDNKLREKNIQMNLFIENMESPIYSAKKEVVKEVEGQEDSKEKVFVIDIEMCRKKITEVKNELEFLYEWIDKYSEMHNYNLKIINSN